MNNKQNLLILTGLVIVGLVAAFIVLQQKPTSTNTANTTSTNNRRAANPGSNPTSSPVGDISGLSRAIVAFNNTLESCYVIYEDNVYLIPKTWADEHPGGYFEIESACGRDITSDFNQGQHSFDAEQMLSSFFLAKLED